MDMKWHWIKEAVERGEVKVDYCNTKAILADLMTKPLPQHAHSTLTRPWQHRGDGVQVQDQVSNEDPRP